MDGAVLWEYKKHRTVERRLPVLMDPKQVGPVYLDDPGVKALWACCS